MSSNVSSVRLFENVYQQLVVLEWGLNRGGGANSRIYGNHRQMNTQCLYESK